MLNKYLISYMLTKNPNHTRQKVKICTTCKSSLELEKFNKKGEFPNMCKCCYYELYERPRIQSKRKDNKCYSTF